MNPEIAALKGALDAQREHGLGILDGLPDGRTWLGGSPYAG